MRLISTLSKNKFPSGLTAHKTDTLPLCFLPFSFSSSSPCDWNHNDCNSCCFDPGCNYIRCSLLCCVFQETGGTPATSHRSPSDLFRWLWQHSNPKAVKCVKIRDLSAFVGIYCVWFMLAGKSISEWEKKSSFI